MYYTSHVNIRASAEFKPADLSRLESLIVPKLIGATQNAADAAAEEARAIVPVDTGELRSSIGTQVEWIGRAVNGYIIARAKHAGFVEFGTGLRGSGTYPYDLPMFNVPITGEWIYDYKQQNWAGMVARPYMRPALDTSRGAILHAYEAAGFTV